MVSDLLGVQTSETAPLSPLNLHTELSGVWVLACLNPYREREKREGERERQRDRDRQRDRER